MPEYAYRPMGAAEAADSIMAGGVMAFRGTTMYNAEKALEWAKWKGERHFRDPDGFLGVFRWPVLEALASASLRDAYFSPFYEGPPRPFADGRTEAWFALDAQALASACAQAGWDFRRSGDGGNRAEEEIAAAAAACAKAFPEPKPDHYAYETLGPEWRSAETARYQATVLGGIAGARKAAEAAAAFRKSVETASVHCEDVFAGRPGKGWTAVANPPAEPVKYHTYAGCPVPYVRLRVFPDALSKVVVVGSGASGASSDRIRSLLDAGGFRHVGLEVLS